jgi:hypothetical protein
MLTISDALGKPDFSTIIIHGKVLEGQLIKKRQILFQELAVKIIFFSIAVAWLYFLGVFDSAEACFAGKAFTKFFRPRFRLLLLGSPITTPIPHALNPAHLAIIVLIVKIRLLLLAPEITTSL